MTAIERRRAASAEVGDMTIERLQSLTGLSAEGARVMAECRELLRDLTNEQRVQVVSVLLALEAGAAE